MSRLWKNRRPTFHSSQGMERAEIFSKPVEHAQNSPADTFFLSVGLRPTINQENLDKRAKCSFKMDSPKPPLLKWTLPLAYLMLEIYKQPLNPTFLTSS